MAFMKHFNLKLKKKKIIKRYKSTYLTTLTSINMQRTMNSYHIIFIHTSYINLIDFILGKKQ